MPVILFFHLGGTLLTAQAFQDDKIEDSIEPVNQLIGASYSIQKHTESPYRTETKAVYHSLVHGTRFLLALVSPIELLSHLYTKKADGLLKIMNTEVLCLVKNCTLKEALLSKEKLDQMVLTELNKFLTGSSVPPKANELAKKETVRSSSTSWLFRVFDWLAWRTATSAELESARGWFEQKLVSKNVVISAAKTLTETVAKEVGFLKLSLIPGSLRRKFGRALREKVLNVLSRKQTEADVVATLLEKSSRKRSGTIAPLKVVVAGVNGVGKSTTIAKLAYLLRGLCVGTQPSCTVVACDTFRSGAIEQLKIHATRLGFVLHAEEYGREPFRVALRGVSIAEQKGSAVILIDTAGRLQNNAQLMDELGKLVAAVQPELVLLVVEALAGTDATSQAEVFAAEVAKARKGRRVDAVVLTKADSVDDRVGTVFSLAYEAALPVVFQGIGQSYQDLVRLDPVRIADLLLDN